MHVIWQPWLICGILIILSDTLVVAQQNSPDQGPSAVIPAAESAEVAHDPLSLEIWNRLIYVPFRELNKVFNNDAATAIVPYAEYIKLLTHYWEKHQPSQSPDAVITKAVYTVGVEGDVARVSAEFSITVLKPSGWVRLPLSLGKVAVGRVLSDDDDNTILKGTGEGHYELLLQGMGSRSVTLELLSSVTTSPEARFFELSCPSVGINELQVTIPEPDQKFCCRPTAATNHKQW